MVHRQEDNVNVGRYYTFRRLLLTRLSSSVRNRIFHSSTYTLVQKYTQKYKHNYSSFLLSTTTGMYYSYVRKKSSRKYLIKILFGSKIDQCGAALQTWYILYHQPLVSISPTIQPQRCFTLMCTIRPCSFTPTLHLSISPFLFPSAGAKN